MQRRAQAREVEDGLIADENTRLAKAERARRLPHKHHVARFALGSAIEDVVESAIGSAIESAIGGLSKLVDGVPRLRARVRVKRLARNDAP